MRQPHLGRETRVGAAGDCAAPRGSGPQVSADGLDRPHPCRPGPVGLAGRVLDWRLTGAPDGEDHLLPVVTWVLRLCRGRRTEGAIEGLELTLGVVSGGACGGGGHKATYQARVQQGRLGVRLTPGAPPSPPAAAVQSSLQTVGGL